MINQFSYQNVWSSVEVISGTYCPIVIISLKLNSFFIWNLVTFWLYIIWDGLFSYPVALKHIAIDFVSVSFTRDLNDMDIYSNRMFIFKTHEGNQAKTNIKCECPTQLIHELTSIRQSLGRPCVWQNLILTKEATFHGSPFLL